MHDSSPVLLLQYGFIPFLHMSHLMKAWPLIYVKFNQENVYQVTHFHRDHYLHMYVTGLFF